MQTQFNIHEAKTRLSQLIEQAEAGGEVVIARAGSPVVRLVPVARAQTRRKLGRLAGEVKLPPEGVPPTPGDVIDVFEGR